MQHSFLRCRSVVRIPLSRRKGRQLPGLRRGRAISLRARVAERGVAPFRVGKIFELKMRAHVGQAGVEIIGANFRDAPVPEDVPLGPADQLRLLLSRRGPLHRPLNDGFVSLNNRVVNSPDPGDSRLHL